GPGEFVPTPPCSSPAKAADRKLTRPLTPPPLRSGDLSPHAGGGNLRTRVLLSRPIAVVVAAGIGPGGVPARPPAAAGAGPEEAAADGAGGREMAEQRLAVAPADGAGKR